MVKHISQFKCEVCGTLFNNLQDAERCESEHVEGNRVGLCNEPFELGDISLLCDRLMGHDGSHEASVTGKNALVSWLPKEVTDKYVAIHSKHSKEG